MEEISFLAQEKGEEKLMARPTTRRNNLSKQSAFWVAPTAAASLGPQHKPCRPELAGAFANSGAGPART